ncbi:MAG: hypothetical protein ACXAES_07545 [Promethearchaeota archaeon]
MWVWWIGYWEMMAADIVLRGPIPTYTLIFFDCFSFSHIFT